MKLHSKLQSIEKESSKGGRPSKANSGLKQANVTIGDSPDKRAHRWKHGDAGVQKISQKKKTKVPWKAIWKYYTLHEKEKKSLRITGFHRKAHRNSELIPEFTLEGSTVRPLWERNEDDPERARSDGCTVHQNWVATQTHQVHGGIEDRRIRIGGNNEMEGWKSPLDDAFTRIDGLRRSSKGRERKRETLSVLWGSCWSTLWHQTLTTSQKYWIRSQVKADPISVSTSVHESKSLKASM